MPLLVTGITCGLLWWVLSELIDPACATMGLIILLCSFGFQRVATMYMAQMPLLMLGLVAVVALLRWRQATSLRWAALIGGSLGWAAVTRPLDAACYGAIVAVGMLPTFKCMRWADRAKSAGIVVVAATPFLLLQIIFNIGVTGSATQTPFALYNQQDQPALAYGTSGDLTRRPASTVPQKQRFYDAFTVRFVQYHNHPDQTPLILWRNRVNVMLPMLTPTVMLLPLLAVGLLGLSTGRRWLVFSLLPLFAASYHLYPIFLFHYILFAMPAVILLYALVPNVVGLAFGEKRSKLARSIVLLGMSGMAIGAQIDRARYELPDERKTERLAIDRLLDQVTEPAIVLFTAPSDRESLHLEVVYNNDVAWPDDAPVIRAHDRGQQNIELYRYYARTAPDRAVWRLDRERMTIQKIGKVRELASGVIAP
jgi:4-amino-4-deoxy-L-arabinose transferase-like glycosyltransferase